MTLTQRSQSGRPQHQFERTESTRSLAFRWLVTFRWHLFGLYLSDLGRSMIHRKYDAFTTDNGYSSTPVGDTAIERAVDRLVRRRDTHVALRQRLELVTSELVESVLAGKGPGQLRLVSGPVGLGRDLRQMWIRLDALGVRPEDWLELAGVDLDATDSVLAQASKLASDQGVPLQAYRADLLDNSGVGVLVGGKADVFNCIGLSTWLDDVSLSLLLEAIESTLAPDGVLIIDHWRKHRGSKYVGALQMPARYLTDSEFEQVLTSAGYRIEQKRETPNGVVVVYRARPHG